MYPEKFLMQLRIRKKQLATKPYSGKAPTTSKPWSIQLEKKGNILLHQLRPGDSTDTLKAAASS
eukprot:snap_masked-scaffold_5-processed-gene-7.40-mRNA-1 protein AED:1.00 eAED:1.00 QI:0/0/0/0/1/1/2/0/63